MTASPSQAGPITVDQAMSVAELLRRQGVDPAIRYLAVAVNGVVVRRVDWQSFMTAAGDVVEIVRPFQGG